MFLTPPGIGVKISSYRKLLEEHPAAGAECSKQDAGGRKKLETRLSVSRLVTKLVSRSSKLVEKQQAVSRRQ
jgi:hypothetical protein